MTAIAHTGSLRRRLQGTVVSHKMQRTAVVEVSHLRRHPRYLKYYRVTKRLKADNPENSYKTGDAVVIEETRPLSKEKRWRIIEKIAEERASAPDSLNPIP